MDQYKLLCLKGFYENELTNNILPFWMERCEDREFGGYFNCYDNLGLNRVSTDKYTWSQGRFVWTFSHLARMEKLFLPEQRRKFLELAENGADFLMAHCLLKDSWCCTFLMDREGCPQNKTVALPVKDPYHIIRNLILIIEALEKHLP